MKTTGEHIKVEVERAGSGRVSNLCNVLREGFSLPAVGEAPHYAEGPAGRLRLPVLDPHCQNCRKHLTNLGLALEALIPLRPEILAARERDYAARRYGWHRESFLKSAHDLAATYRRMAEDVEAKLARFPEDSIARPGVAFQLANELLHHQAWAVANTSLDTLMTRAVELDQTAREAR